MLELNNCISEETETESQREQHWELRLVALLNDQTSFTFLTSALAWRISERAMRLDNETCQSYRILRFTFYHLGDVVVN